MSSTKSRNKIMIIGVFLILINILLIINVFLPKIQIDIIGKSIIKVKVGQKYEDNGAKAFVKNILGEEQIEVETLGEVNTAVVGKYIIKYQAKANGIVTQKYRIVNVVDDENPIININGNAKACKNNKIVNINATAFDNYDGDLTSNLKYQIKNNEVVLIIKDSSDNEAKAITYLDYIDKEKPKITLNGKNVIYLNLYDEYKEFGAQSTDSCDGDLTDSIKISGNVDTSKEGTYLVKYKSKDSYGNEVQAERKIIVSNEIGKVTNGNIYLTFDDGPGVYTEEYLKVLQKYNVKATFFVTGQFSKYYDLIKKEYEQGHTIGIHTYSHKWTIYESVETYLEDFNKIDNIVYEQTQTHPKYFRFPGGSSNTISRRYCKNIMTDLANLMTTKGYVYFDWTFDSGDTVKGKNNKEEIIKTVKKYLTGNGDYIILMHDIKKTPVKHFKIAN